jgi:hypothetical protein
MGTDVPDIHFLRDWIITHCPRTKRGCLSGTMMYDGRFAGGMVARSGSRVHLSTFEDLAKFRGRVAIRDRDTIVLYGPMMKDGKNSPHWLVTWSYIAEHLHCDISEVRIVPHDPGS